MTTTTMSDAEWSSILAHLTLAASCGWAHEHMPYDGIVWISITLMLHHAVGVLGILIGLILRFGDSNAEFVYRLAHVYNFFFGWGLLLGLPCTVAQHYSYHGYAAEISSLHVLLALVPFITNDRSSLDCLIFVNICSLAFVSIVANNLLGVVTSTCYGVNYFSVRPRLRVGDIRAKDLYICLLALFNYLAIMALKF